MNSDNPTTFRQERISVINACVYVAAATVFRKGEGESILLGPTRERAFMDACQFYGPDVRMDLVQNVVLMQPAHFRRLLEMAGLESTPYTPPAKEATPTISLKPVKQVGRRRKQIFAESDGKCHYCATPLTLDGKWHVEHKMPRALGGGDDPGNLVASCVPCNHGKRDTTDIEFKAKLAKKADSGVAA